MACATPDDPFTMYATDAPGLKWRLLMIALVWNLVLPASRRTDPVVKLPRRLKTRRDT